MENRSRYRQSPIENQQSTIKTQTFFGMINAEEFDAFWLKLLAAIDDQADRLVAYKIDARNAKETVTAGNLQCRRPQEGFVLKDIGD